MAEEQAGTATPGWKRDPWGRFAGRYWDGQRWTDQVIGADRVRGVDAVPSAPPAPVPPAIASPRATPAEVVRSTDEESGSEPRTWRTWQLAAATVVALLIGFAAGSSGSKSSSYTVSAGSATTAPIIKVTNAPATTARTTAPVATAPVATAPATAPPNTAAPGPKTTFGNGQYRVGIDIAPGTYVAPGGSACYWERQSTFGGGGSADIIANDLSQGGQVLVTIAAGDKGFKTSGCGTWTKG